MRGAEDRTRGAEDRTGRGAQTGHGAQRTEDRMWGMEDGGQDAGRGGQRTGRGRGGQRTGRGAQSTGGTPSAETESGTEPQGELWFPENRCGLGLTALSQVGEAKSLECRQVAETPLLEMPD